MSSKKRVLALALSMSMIFGSVGDFATLAVSAEEAVPEVQTEAVQAEAAAPQPAAESTAPAPAAEAPAPEASQPAAEAPAPEAVQPEPAAADAAAVQPEAAEGTSAEGVPAEAVSAEAQEAEAAVAAESVEGDAAAPAEQQPEAAETPAEGTEAEAPAEAAPAEETAAPTEESAGPAEGTAETAEAPAEAPAPSVEEQPQTPEAEEAAPEETPQEPAPFGIQAVQAVAPVYTESVAKRDELPAVGLAEGETETPKESTSEAADNRKVALQQMIKEKLASLSSFSGKVQIILAKNTTYEGDVSIEKGEDQEVADDFQLELVSEDALNEEGEAVEGGGTGKTTVNGDMNIKGMNVLLRGVAVALGKKINVSAATLGYEGVEGKDALDVYLGENGATTINAYGGDDDITVTAYEGASGAEINTAGGNDKVTVTAYSGNIKLDSGEGDDAVNARLMNGTGESAINTGDGKDTVDLVIADNSGTTVNTGADADTVNIDAQYGGDNLTVNTDDGDDKVTVKDSDDMSSGDSTAVMTINLGNGGSRLEVDTTAARSFATINATASKADGSLLYLTGELKKENDRMGWASNEKKGVKMITSDGNLTVNGTDTFTILTDSLKNKVDKKLSEAGGQYAEFTDYKVDESYFDSEKGAGMLETKKILTMKDLSIQRDTNLAFSNLTVDQDYLSTMDTDETKNVQKIIIQDLKAPGFNVVIKANNVDLDGVISADNITVAASDSMNAHNHALESQSFDGVMSSIVGKASDILNITNDAVIHVTENARLYARGNVDLLATVDQSGWMLDLDFSFGNSFVESIIGANYSNLGKLINPVNVKVGKAKITIDKGAQIIAGYGYDGKGSSSNVGSVNMEAKLTADVTAGIGKKIVKLPMAINVLYEQANVTAEEGSTIKAARNIDLNANSTLKAEAKTDTSMIPLALTVGVLVNGVYADAKGTLIAGKNVNVKATGDITDKSTAWRGKGESGVYVSTNVVVQDVMATIAKTAVVNAGGDVVVKTTANADVTTTASSSEEPEEKTDSEIQDEKTDSGTDQIKKGALGLLKEYGGKLLKWLKIKVIGDSDTRSPGQKTIDAMKSVAGGEYQIKLSDDSEQKGDVKFKTDKQKDGQAEGVVYTTVTIDPWPGHEVEKVWYAYIENKDDEDAAEKYTIRDAAKQDDGTWKILQRNYDVQVFVEYKDTDEDTSKDNDYDVSSLFDEKEEDEPLGIDDLAKYSINGAEDEDEEEEEQKKDDKSGSDDQKTTDEDGNEQKLLFSIEKTTTEVDNAKWTAGSILNKSFNHKTGVSIVEATRGEKITLIANAKKGYKLKDDGLVVSYYKKGEDKEQKITVKKDDKGEYTFTVPEDLETGHYSNLYDFKITGEFEKEEKSSDDEYKADTSATQINGSIAVTVISNDGKAEVEDGAQITAKGDLTLESEQKTAATTNTDGTGTSKNQKKKDEEKKKNQEEYQKILTQYIVPGHEVAVTLSAVNGGKVETERRGSYEYTFTTTQNGNTPAGKVTATLRYKSGGSWKTANLDVDSNGKVKLNLNAYVIDKGTTALVNFAFADATSESQAAQDLVDRSISVKYNVQKLSKEEDPYDVSHKKLGTVYFVKTDKDNTRYYFNIVPDTDNGYTVDAADSKDPTKSNIEKLYATYKNGSGQEVKVALHQDSGSNYWYVDTADLKGEATGDTVEVHATFEADKRKVVKHEGFKPEDKKGDISFDKEEAKASDTITITQKPDKNFGYGDVTVFYYPLGSTTEKSMVLSVDEKGQAKFTVPKLAKDTTIRVSASFKEQTLTLKNGSASDVSMKTDEKVSAGSKVEVSVSDSAKKAGKKLVDKATITYFKDSNRTEVIVDIKDGKVEIPKDATDNSDVTITIKTQDKAITLQNKDSKLQNGSLTFNSSKADPGEAVELTINADEGYRYKDGSGTADITTNSSTYHVKLKRKDGKTLTFTLPSTLNEQEIKAGNVSIKLNAEFEKGYGDTEQYQTSFGAALVVAVVNTDNDAVISGGKIEAANVNVKANTDNNSKGSASAGYTKAETGFAGGLGINVSSFDTSALVKKGNANSKITAGSLTVAASGNHAFDITGSAAGGPDTAETGIGSGIAVSVNSADVKAGIQDGANVSLGTGTISATASNKTDDKITAKAGAKGETGVTPVIAVDVIGTSADSYIGNVVVDGDAGKALTNNAVIVTASNTASHNMNADANVTGGGAALGGSFGINVIHDRALAQLKKSVAADKAAGKVTINSTSTVTQKATVNASASGGAKGKSGEKGDAGSADKQTDKIMGGAGNISSRNNSKSLSMKGSGSQDRQKAQTSEGSIAGAAAVAVNVIGTSSKAEIVDGVNVKSGDVSVASVNRTVVDVKANGSTAKSDIGVGVAVAVNIVNITNIAEIGNGSIDAGKLTVTALMPEQSKVQTDDIDVVKVQDDEDKMVQQFTATIKESLNSLISGMGFDQEFIGEFVATFSKTFINYILKETGLTDLFGKGTFEEKKEKAMNSLNELFGKIKAYPMELLEPLMTLIDQVEGVENADASRIGNILLEEIKTQIPSLLMSTIQGTFNRVKDDLGGTLIQMINYKIKGKSLDKSLDDLKKIVKNAALAEWKSFYTKLAEDAVTKLRSELPYLTQENFDKIKYLFTSSFEKKKTDFIDQLTSTFENKVFNYTAVIEKINKTDFKKAAEDMIRNALKDSTVAGVNYLMDTALSKLDIQITPEDNSGKHVITTQAIAGSGSKSVSIAGSVAITVLHSDTRATIKNGSAMTVDHETIVDARETRKVDTTATAALDQKEKADKNEDGSKKEEKDTGSGDAAESKTMAGENYVVKSKAGGEVEQDLSDPTIVWITPKEGYKIEAGDGKAEYTYTDKDNKEQTAKIKVYEKDKKYYVKTSDAKKVDGKTTTITVTPTEDLKTISGIETIAFSVDDSATKNVPDNTVSVSVEGRDDKVENNKLKAKKTDTVKITIDKTKMKGYKIDTVEYMTADNKRQKIEFCQTENSSEAVYAFEMPGQDVTAIFVEFEKLEEGEEESKETTDSKGRTVGVGAAFSMVYGNSDVKAEINRDITSGTLTVNARSDHNEDITSVSGTDPLSGDMDTDATKDVSVDASIALNILDNSINAAVNGKATTIESGTGDAAKIDEQHSLGDFRVISNEQSITDTHASGYASGNSTAVGAAVAINIASSDVKTSVKGDVISSGNAEVTSLTHNEDNTQAFATAMGASISRSLASIGDKVTSGVAAVQKLFDGSVFDKKAENKDGKNSKNDTAKKINSKMDTKKDSEGKNSSENLSLSTNILRNQNVTTEDGSSADSTIADGTKEMNSATGKDASGNDNKGDKKSYQVAAAVGVTVTSHAAKTSVAGNIKATKNIKISSENTDNYMTKGTGIAMSLAKASNSIAAGVAVSVNQNKAKVDVTGGLISTGGDVEAKSNLTQNMDGDYKGKLGAQALAGSVSGADSTMSLAGAISVLVTNAQSTVDVKKGSGTDGDKITGQQITVSALDKSKLAVRAGGVSISRGSSVGMGVSAAAVKSSNTVTSNVGDGFTVTGNAFDVIAKKLAVTMKDYQMAVSLTDVVTDSSQLNDEQRKEAKTGIIDVHKGEGDKNYKIDVNLSSEDMLKAVDLLNFLSSTNYYAEAIAGSVMSGGGDSKLSAAGSFSIVIMKNVVKAEIGKSIVNLTKANGKSGDMNVKADSETNTRMISGALSAAPSMAGVGLTFAFLDDEDDVTSKVGANSVITNDGNFDQHANVDSYNQVFTIAASVAAGSKAKAAVGGAVNVILTQNKANAIFGDGASVTAGGKANVSSGTNMDLTLVSASIAGTNGKAAVGGTVNVIVDEAQSNTKLGSGAKLTAGGDVTVDSKIKETLISGGISASAAVSSSSAAIAGAISVLVTRSTALTDLASNVKLNATNGSIGVHADSDTMMVNAMLSAAGAGTAAVGAAIGANVYKRNAKVEIAGSETTEEGKYDFEAGNNIDVRANAQDRTISIGLAIAGAKDAAISGNIQATVGQSTVENKIAGKLNAKAAGSALFESTLNDYFINALGSIAVSGQAGVGASIAVVVKNSTVNTELGEAKVSALGGGTLKEKDGTTLRGILASAKAKETQFVLGAGIAGGGTAGVTGIVVTDVSSNTVKANAKSATLDAYTGANGDTTSNVVATEDTTQTLIAGGLNIGGTAGVGASVVTLVSGKTVEAKAGTVKARKDAGVKADNKDTVFLLAVSAGAAGSVAVEVGASIEVLKSEVTAELVKEAYSDNGNINVLANNTTDLVNAAVTAAGAGAAAVTPTAVVTYFKGSTKALVDADAVAKFGGSSQNGRSMNVKADSTKTIDLYSVGAAAGGAAGVSGTANILVAKDTTSAKIGKNADINLGTGTFNNSADSAYNVTAASAAIAASAVAAVAVNAVINILKGTTEAELAGKVTANKVNVTASGSRDVNMGALSASVSGTAAVGATVLVLNAGEKMNQDAINTLKNGNGDGIDDVSADGEDGQEIKAKQTFSAGTFLNSAKEEGADVSDIGDIESELQGDGRAEADTKIGTRGRGFDAASGYRSGEFDTKSKKDTDETQRGETKGLSEDHPDYPKDLDETQKKKLQMKESSNIKNSKKQGGHSGTFTSKLTDKVTAIITDTAELTVKNGSVTVKASQPTLADVFGGNVALSAGASVGGSVAIVQMRSNVDAQSQGTIVGDGSTVEVKAVSNATSKEIKADSEEAERTKMIQKNTDGLLEKLDPNNRSIRAIGMAISGGLVGVSAAVSAVRSDNVTNAEIGGTITGVKAVDVSADADYDNVLAATLSIGGGVAGLSASVAITQTEGNVTARMNDSTDIDTNEAAKISVKTNTVQNANALAAGAAAGLGAANAGVSIAGNTLTQNTSIDRGASVKTGKGGSVTVKGVSNTRADAELLSIAASIFASNNISSAKAHVKPTMNTGIGVQGTSKENTTIDTKGGGSVSVESVAASTATPAMAAIAASAGASLNGAALLAYNETVSDTKIAHTDVDTGSINVNGVLKTTGKSELTQVSVGFLGAGINSTYVDVNATNRTTLDITGADIHATDGITVSNGGRTAAKNLPKAPTKPVAPAPVGEDASESEKEKYKKAYDEYKAELEKYYEEKEAYDEAMQNITGGYFYDSYSNAVTSTVSGSLGAITVGYNAAIARNRAVNTAQIIGDGTFYNEGDTNVNSFSKGVAETNIEGMDIGLLSAGISFGMALNEANSVAQMKLDNTFENEGDMNFASMVVGNTDSSTTLGGGSLASAKATVGVSYGRTRSIVDVDLAQAPEENTIGMITANSNGENSVNTEIANSAISLVKLSGLVGAAYNQDEYQTKIRFGEGDFEVKGIDARTNFNTKSTSTVTPSSGGYDVSLGGLQINVATARNTAYMNTELDVEGGNVTAEENVDVITTGKGNAEAKVKGAKVTVAAVNLAANTAKADVSTRQAAMVNLKNGTLATELDDPDEDEDEDDDDEDYDDETPEERAAREDAPIVINEKVGKITVKSETTQDTAEASTGSTGGKNENIAIELVSGGLSSATARQNAQSTAGIMGSGITYNRVVSRSLELSSLAGKANRAIAENENPAKLGLFTMGAMESNALSTESHMTMLTGLTANIKNNAVVQAKADSTAKSTGSSPGAKTAVNLSNSEISSKIGSKDDTQKANVVVGENLIFTAGNALFEAVNQGHATAFMNEGSTYSVANVTKSMQPTESWYDTGVAIGKGASLRATGRLFVKSTENMGGSSVIDSDSKNGLLFNLNTMKGYNELHGNSLITVGESAVLSSAGKMAIEAVSNVDAVAKTMMNGGFGFYSGNAVEAVNYIDRNIRVDIGNHARLSSLGSKIYIATASGMEDHIETQAHSKGVKGLLELSNAIAEATLKSATKINIGGDVWIEGADTVEILNTATTHGKLSKFEFSGVLRSVLGKSVADKAALVNSVTPGMYTSAGLDSGGAVAAPVAKAYTHLDLDTQINIAKGWTGAQTKIGKDTARRGSSIRATNRFLNIQTNALSVGKAAFGKSQGDAQTEVIKMNNLIYIDNAKIKTSPDIRTVSADNGIDYPAYFYTAGRAEFFGAAGEVNPIAKIKGEMGNYIQTHKVSAVDGGGWTNEQHRVEDPRNATEVIVKATYDRFEIKIFGFTITGTIKKVVEANDLTYHYFCDFCTDNHSGDKDWQRYDKGDTGDTADETQARINNVVNNAIDLALKRLQVLKDVFEKALSELIPTQTVENSDEGLTIKGTYDEEEKKAASITFNTDIEKLLEKDISFSGDWFDHYHVWDNLINNQSVYLLPNATRLMAETGRFRYISEVIRGDVFGTGEKQVIDVITALTENAYSNPVVSIGRAGSLNFAKSELRLFESSELDLYEYEISADWLKQSLESGFIRLLTMDLDKISGVINNGDQPEGEILEGITEDASMLEGSVDEKTKEEYAIKAYWIGNTPETAESDDEPLYFMLVVEDADMVQAFRTSKAMLQNEEEPVPVSLCLYRDSKSDRQGVDKYNMIFYDVPEGEKPTVSLITNVLQGRKIEVPKSLTLKLRVFEMEGFDLPVYSISDHLFALVNGTEGTVELFDGFYKASFDGDVFDSDYTRVEGIASAKPIVTIKAGQEIWPENVSETESVTISGDRYLLVDDEWIEQTGSKEAAEETSETEAA